MKKTIMAIMMLIMMVSVFKAQNEYKPNPNVNRTIASILANVIDDTTEALRVLQANDFQTTFIPADPKKQKRTIEQLLLSIIDVSKHAVRLSFPSAVTFPFQKLVTNWSDNSKVFRFFVSPNGNDNNDGLTWATAKRQINAVLLDLPPDLRGYKVNIFIHPGTYSNVSGRFSNALIEFMWAGTFVNTGTGAFCTWARNGAVNPIANDNDVDIVTTNSNPAIDIQSPLANSLTVTFNGINWDNFISTGTNSIYYAKIKFSAISPGAPTYLSFFKNVRIETESGFCLNMGTTVNRGIALQGESSTYLPYLKIIGGTGEASVNTGSGYAAISVETSSGGNINISPGWTASRFVSGFGLTNSKYYDITGIRNLFRDELNPSPYIKFTSINYAQGSLPDANLPYVRLSGYKGYMEYSTAMVQFTDASTYPRIIKNATTGVTNNYISPKLNDDGSTLNFNVPIKLVETTTNPTVLLDGEASLSLKSDKLVIKFNSAGTIKYFYLDLTSTAGSWTYTTTAP